MDCEKEPHQGVHCSYYDVFDKRVPEEVLTQQRIELPVEAVSAVTHRLQKRNLW
jgi:hypothetical protein